MEDKRFRGIASKDYDISTIGIPHRMELQQKITDVIKKSFKNSKIHVISVVEIGCGTGQTTTAILESDKRVHVSAVDNEPSMIKQAKIFLKEFIDTERVKLIEKDALNFLKKQHSNSFDVFASAFTLHNFRRNFRNKILKEIFRVLKKDGIFVNADKYALDDILAHKKTLNWQLNRFKTEYSKINRQDLVEEWTNHYLEDDKPDIIMKELESFKIMKELGFKDSGIIFRKQMDAVLVAKKYIKKK
jgi:ubiquinone/menaquinone biosynthesis C-methylase UbiE